MARRVADVRLGLQVLMGAHPRDPWSIDAPFAGPPLARPIRVAVSRRRRAAASIRRCPRSCAAPPMCWPTPATTWSKPARRATKKRSRCGRGFIMGDFGSVLDQLAR